MHPPNTSPHQYTDYTVRETVHGGVQSPKDDREGIPDEEKGERNVGRM